MTDMSVVEADSAVSCAKPHSAETPLGLCLDCNYPLWGLPTPRCPECGREFDPLDPKSMNMGRSLTAFARWAMGPLRWPVNLLSWAAMGYALWMARLPGAQLRNSSSLIILFALGLFWLTWPMVRVSIARKYGWPHSLLMRGQRQRVTVGIALLLASMAVWYDLPLKAALYISRPAMDHMATELLASGNPYTDDQWLGVYKATRIKVSLGRTVRITCEESNRAYRSGFIYLPNVDPKRTTWTGKNYHHVSGPWWAWREEG
jgi:hypothetical protein